MTPPASGTSSGPSGGASGGEPTARQVAGRRWRASRGVIGTILVLILVTIVIAALKPSGKPDDLDPTSASQGGTRALAETLRQHGTPVSVARNSEQAVQQATSTTVLVVTRPERLTRTDVDRLKRAGGDVLLVEPSRDLLDALAPGVQEAVPTFEAADQPDCTLPAAVMAGSVGFGEAQLYEAPPGATSCYKSDGLGRLVQIQTVGGRTVTVIGSADPLTNKNLADDGNAALAMNLAGARSSVVWLMPDLPTAGEGGDRSFMDLVPFGVKLFVLQSLVAVALLALWRSRRLGPVVAEALPVVVRSSETVEGRSRLYRAHRARDRAADALRAGARERLVPLLGLPRSAAQDPASAQEIVTAIAARTTHDEATINAALYGPEPGDDVQLVGLTDFLDDLERQVHDS
ncbi:DUF4350 domain-containing protein [Actinomadura barringtoniae]|uniref:DUF4350 domain-containing protein n=1 Tax=Actinomadura barringtoniae TaxID=1427535 RepID=A0A939PEU8_9ACTN|nr:DUF4350 domain-containing protein [Actinomadura barringtoniae]